jgi:hypothetical protein
MRYFILLIAFILSSCNNAMKEKLGAIPPAMDEYSLKDETLIEPPFYHPSPVEKQK